MAAGGAVACWGGTRGGRDGVFGARTERRRPMVADAVHSHLRCLPVRVCAGVCGCVCVSECMREREGVGG